MPTRNLASCTRPAAFEGTVEVFDPFSDSDKEFTAGGFQSGGGLRLRF